jgi:predicted Zn-dependent protease
LPSASLETESDKPIIELGWVLAGHMQQADLEATRKAKDRLKMILEETFTDFDWRMPLVMRREMIHQHRVGPLELLEGGAVERETARWDFGLVVTEADLKGHYKTGMLGAPSQSVNVAVISTSRLDPEATGEPVSDEDRVEFITRRVVALAMHLLGHLNQLKHSSTQTQYMFHPRGIADLDAMTHFSAKNIKALTKALHSEADERVEERGHYQGKQGPLFLLSALRHDKVHIFNATMEIRPWLFPFLLTRLTTAAVSTMIVLINTAEAWDLGLSQPPWRLVIMSLATLFGASVFLVKRQHLLVPLKHGQWSEQRVIATSSLCLAVFLGMCTMYTMLFVCTFLLGELLFSPELVSGWAATLQEEPTHIHHLRLSAFIASMGIIIGALGASFESEDYFKHIAMVDEET